MCLLLETIRIENGRPCNLEYHQHRVDHTRAALFGDAGPLDLSSLNLPRVLPAGIFKWRIVYGEKVTESTVGPYHPKQIKSVRLVVRNEIDYSFKYADRSVFAELLKDKGGCDDILVVRNGLLTDLSYANAAFFDGVRWFTPRNPLLAGTCRARLLDEGQLAEVDIRPDDLHRYKTVSVINAMLGLGEMTFPVGGIIP